MPEKLKKGELTFLSTSEYLLALKRQDKKDVYMLSTVHSAEMVETSKMYRQTGTKQLKP